MHFANNIDQHEGSQANGAVFIFVSLKLKNASARAMTSSGQL